jgi:hypothetical protein
MRFQIILLNSINKNTTLDTLLLALPFQENTLAQKKEGEGPIPISHYLNLCRFFNATTIMIGLVWPKKTSFSSSPLPSLSENGQSHLVGFSQQHRLVLSNVHHILHILLLLSKIHVRI